MNEFQNKLCAFLGEFGIGKSMVLSTSLHDKVTSRMMSVVQKDGVFYFQTDKTFRKYEQLTHNANVALCIDNIQIEGICEELGHPKEHHDFCEAFAERFQNSYKHYSGLPNERLFRVTPTRIERWLYEGDNALVEVMDVENETYTLSPYEIESV